MANDNVVITIDDIDEIDEATTITLATQVDIASEVARATKQETKLALINKITRISAMIGLILFVTETLSIFIEKNALETNEDENTWWNFALKGLTWGMLAAVIEVIKDSTAIEQAGKIYNYFTELVTNTPVKTIKDKVVDVVKTVVEPIVSTVERLQASIRNIDVRNFTMLKKILDDLYQDKNKISDLEGKIKELHLIAEKLQIQLEDLQKKVENENKDEQSVNSLDLSSNDDQIQIAINDNELYVNSDSTEQSDTESIQQCVSVDAQSTASERYSDNEPYSQSQIV